MTPCEKRGWKVGDRFVAKKGSTTFSHGSLIQLDRDDGTAAPLFALIEGRCEYNNATGRKPGAYEELQNVRPISNNPFHKLAKAAKSAKKTDKELAKHNAQLPEGLEIVRKSGVIEIDAGDMVSIKDGRVYKYEAGASRPKDTYEDMSDWRNWRVGDLVEATKNCHSSLTTGKLYLIESISGGFVRVKTDGYRGLDGFGEYRGGHHLKFHSRPVQS